ncbi:phosphodiester glycosidase family protein [Halobacillus litoralis]|uniref:phosphodiester glycosidase family protein n=1 Tax=Halobacillus litoralis TaxID=45668 RepID=UPI001CD74074|nr:phosphodiester glycosidase family protein [Halobacillus litoralis]MCA0971548.1 phosphodiester glycosidase family protein [Halobacillus litoralis]
MAFGMVFAGMSTGAKAATYELDTIDSFQPAPTVTYKKQQQNSGSIEQMADVMEIDVSEQNTTVQLGLPTPYPRLGTLSSQAQAVSGEGNRVVGGINGSFFHFLTQKPAYMVSKGQRIITMGAVSQQSNDFMYTPAAFGMNENGDAMTGTYELDMEFTHDGDTQKVDSVNTSRGDGEIILYTSSYGKEFTKTNPYGYEVVVTGVDKTVDGGEMSFGDTISGTVKAKRSYGNKDWAEIPDDGFVLSFGGGQLASRYQDVQPGDSIELKIDVDDPWDDSEFMLASGPMLLQNGKVDLTIDLNSPKVTMPQPHTAVGTNADGSKVYFVTVDGRNSVADGMRLDDFARYLQSLGVYNAVNLDGGGSTSMVARKKAYIYPSVMNRPSDGSERRISTSLMAVIQNPDERASEISFYKEKQGQLLEGAEVNVGLSYVLDEYFTYLEDVDADDIEWSVEGNVGRMEGTTFVAEQAGTGQIVAEYEDAVEKRDITVVDEIDRFDIAPGDLQIGTDTKQTFTFEAADADGNPIILPENAVKWSADASVGTMNDNGTLTTGSEETTGSITATINGQSVSADVQVGGDTVVLSDFDNAGDWSVSTVRSWGQVRGAQGFEPIAEGSSSLRLDYNFRTGGAGTSATYAVPDGGIDIPGKPNHLGLWVYGDDADHWLRARIVDGEGNSYAVNLTEEDQLNWKGWKYVEAKLPDAAALPLKLDQIYIAETTESEKDKNVLFLDQLKAFYDDSKDDVEAMNLPEYDIYPTNKTWEVTFNTRMDEDSFTNENIYVTNHLGNKVPVTVDLNATKRVAYISAESGDFLKDHLFELVVTDKLESAYGLELKESRTMRFMTR